MKRNITKKKKEIKPKKREVMHKTTKTPSLFPCSWLYFIFWLICNYRFCCWQGFCLSQVTNSPKSHVFSWSHYRLGAAWAT